MRRKALVKLLAGFRRFHERYFEGEDPTYTKLGSGQSPKSLVISCSDSRVDPAIISDAGPGELFVVRNIANLVPPFETGGKYHGVSAAIEFAVTGLNVENILVMGHRQCGGIRAMVTGLQNEPAGFVDRWMEIARPAHFRALAAHPEADSDVLCRHCERESIKISIDNLRTFPFVVKAEKERAMNIIGLYFDLENGHLLELDEKSGEFNELSFD